MYMLVVDNEVSSIQYSLYTYKNENIYFIYQNCSENGVENEKRKEMVVPIICDEQPFQ